MGTIEGPILGAIVYFLLDENLSELGAWWFIILGVFLIVVMLRAPKGLWGLIQHRTGLRLFPVQRRLVRKETSAEKGRIVRSGTLAGRGMMSYPFRMEET